MDVYWDTKFYTKEPRTTTGNVLLTPATQILPEWCCQICRLANGIKCQLLLILQEAKDPDHRIFTSLKVCMRQSVQDFDTYTAMEIMTNAFELHSWC